MNHTHAHTHTQKTEKERKNFSLHFLFHFVLWGSKNNKVNLKEKKKKRRGEEYWTKPNLFIKNKFSARTVLYSTWTIFVFAI